MRTTVATVVLAVALGGVACNRESRGDKVNEASVATANQPADNSGEHAQMAEVPVSEPMRAQAQLTAAEGSKIDGEAKFFQQPDGVLVVLEVQDATPGKKGVHVHTRGDCSDIKGQSMGPHFAPKLEQHALPSEGTDRHLGDLGNITVGKDGKGTHEITVPGANLKEGDKNSYLGKAIIIHEKKDDGGQPVGNAGGRIGCGEIK